MTDTVEICLEYVLIASSVGSNKRAQQNNIIDLHDGDNFDDVMSIVVIKLLINYCPCLRTFIMTTKKETWRIITNYDVICVLLPPKPR